MVINKLFTDNSDNSSQEIEVKITDGSALEIQSNILKKNIVKYIW